MPEGFYFFKSRTRRELLAVFFTNPGQKYYLRELERLLGFSAGNIRRELLKFSASGLLKTERTGNLLYYRADISHPLYKEIKSIVFKTAGVESKLRKELSDIENIETAFIYGSFASGQENPASDIDVFIIGKPDMSSLARSFNRIEATLGREINPTVYVKSDFLKKAVSSEFIKDILKRPKIFLVGSENDIQRKS